MTSNARDSSARATVVHDDNSPNNGLDTPLVRVHTQNDNPQSEIQNPGSHSPVLAMPFVPYSISRRDALKVGVGAGLALTLDRLPAFAPTTLQCAPLIQPPIPPTGEKLPIVGIGTARNYENPSLDAIPALRDVLRQFPQFGGRVIDTAPSYGRAESVVGDLLEELRNRDKYFIATKVSIRGGGRDAAVAQME